MDQEASSCGSWPEQEAVDSWIKKYNIKADFKQVMELKKAVSEYRIITQKEAETARMASFPWWRKDALGWPVVFIKGRHVYNIVSIIRANFKKLAKS